VISFSRRSLENTGEEFEAAEQERLVSACKRKVQEVRICPQSLFQDVTEDEVLSTEHLQHDVDHRDWALAEKLRWFPRRLFVVP